MKNIVISEHAWNRWLDRFPKLTPHTTLEDEYARTVKVPSRILVRHHIAPKPGYKYHISNNCVFVTARIGEHNVLIVTVFSSRLATWNRVFQTMSRRIAQCNA